MPYRRSSLKNELFNFLGNRGGVNPKLKKFNFFCLFLLKASISNITGEMMDFFSSNNNIKNTWLSANYNCLSCSTSTSCLMYNVFEFDIELFQQLLETARAGRGQVLHNYPYKRLWPKKRTYKRICKSAIVVGIEPYTYMYGSILTTIARPQPHVHVV